MKFYHCFHTTLPDQFVEANSAALIKWTDGWKDKNRYYQRSRVIDTIPVNFTGNAKVNEWPTLQPASEIMLSHWMKRKGDSYSGGYWESLTEDQRSPVRVASDPGRDQGTAIWTYPSTVQSWSSFTRPGAASPRLSGKQIAALQAAMNAGLTNRIWSTMLDDMVEKPPLKREGIVAGEIVGYRCWRVEKGLLRSVYQTDQWTPGQVLEGRELGDWDSRGIHAWKSSGSKEYHDYIRSYLNQEGDFVFRTMMRGTDVEARPAMVTGTVFLWGDVVEHERGYRAEYARVRSLDWLYPDAGMMGREQETLDALRLKYAPSLPSPQD